MQQLIRQLLQNKQTNYTQNLFNLHWILTGAGFLVFTDDQKPVFMAFLLSVAGVLCPILSFRE